MKAVSIFASGPVSGAAALAQSAPEYGTSQVSYVQIPGPAFVAQNSNSVLAVLGNGLSGQALRVVGGSGPQYFTAALQVPSGALLKSVRYDAVDASGGSGALVTGALVVTDALGNVQTASPTVDSAGTGCQSLTTDLTGLALTVDNNAKPLLGRREPRRMPELRSSGSRASPSAISSRSRPRRAPRRSVTCRRTIPSSSTSRRWPLRE